MRRCAFLLAVALAPPWKACAPSARSSSIWPAARCCFARITECRRRPARPTIWPSFMKRGFKMPEIFAAESGIKTKAQTIAVMDQAFRALLIHMDEHLGEHLGQSIAYARVNHIVPPWSQKK